jgi:hypothetical protein
MKSTSIGRMMVWVAIAAVGLAATAHGRARPGVYFGTPGYECGVCREDTRYQAGIWSDGPGGALVFGVTSVGGVVFLRLGTPQLLW